MWSGGTSCSIVGDLKCCMSLGQCKLKHQPLPAEHVHLSPTLSFYSSSFIISRIQIKGSIEYRHFIFHLSRNQVTELKSHIGSHFAWQQWQGKTNIVKMEREVGEGLWSSSTQSADKVGMYILAEWLHSMFRCTHVSEQDEQSGPDQQTNRQRNCNGLLLLALQERSIRLHST